MSSKEIRALVKASGINIFCSWNNKRKNDRMLKFCISSDFMHPRKKSFSKDLKKLIKDLNNLPGVTYAAHEERAWGGYRYDAIIVDFM